MDYSLKYITMCEKAKEIQKLCLFDELDLFYITKIRDSDKPYYDNDPPIYWIGEPIFYCSDDVGLIYKEHFFPELNVNRQDIHPFIEWVWLPCQDQLQEIILMDWKDKKPCWLLFKFYNWVNLAEKQNEWIDDYTSMEQLWLAFVMKEKHNKTWNNKEWIK